MRLVVKDVRRQDDAEASSSHIDRDPDRLQALSNSPAVSYSPEIQDTGHYGCSGLRTMCQRLGRSHEGGMRVQGQLDHPARAQRHEVSSLLVGIALTPGAKGAL